MKRVLVVSYFYPPYSSVGATRVSKMTRYLRDHNWEPTVLTVADDDRPQGIELEIPPVNIHRVAQTFDVTAGPRSMVGKETVAGRRFARRPGWGSKAFWRLALVYRNVVCFPDPQIGWLLPAVREGRRLIKEVQPHVICSSSFPNTSHLVAYYLARESGIPWVAEMRDLWTDNHNFRRVAPLRFMERLLERMVLSRADALVTVSPVWAALLEKRFGRPTYVVPNGFDPLDYNDLPPPAANNGRFTLLYTGMFYNGKQDPDPLIEAIASMAREGTLKPEQFRLRLVGHYLEPIVARAEAAGVQAFVDVEPPVPYRDSVALQCGATALLFLDWADGREKGWYSAKIYEYLGARRPILSVGPRDSVVAELLHDSRAGVVGQTASEVRGLLTSWIKEYERTGTLICSSDPAALVPHHRQTAAASMADVLNRYART
jgi:hypothetical protein